MDHLRVAFRLALDRASLPGGQSTLGGEAPPAPRLATGPPYPTHKDISADLLRTGRLQAAVGPANLNQAICTVLCTERFPHARSAATRHTLCQGMQPKRKGMSIDSDAVAHMSRLASETALQTYVPASPLSIATPRRHQPPPEPVTKGARAGPPQQSQAGLATQTPAAGHPSEAPK